MLVCPLGLTLVAQIFQKVACFWSSLNFYPNLPIFLHGYIRHIRDIFQLWSHYVYDDCGALFINFLFTTVVKVNTIVSVLVFYCMSINYNDCTVYNVHLAINHRCIRLLQMYDRNIHSGLDDHFPGIVACEESHQSLRHLVKAVDNCLPHLDFIRI